MKEIILKYPCDACGSNKWTEFNRYFDYDANFEKITWKCLNCGHTYTGNENFLKGESNE